MAEELIFGIHAVQAALERRPQNVSTVWMDEARQDRRLRELGRMAEAARVTTRKVPRRKLDEITQGERHQGVVARCQPLPIRGERDLEKYVQGLDETPFLLVLDGIQDPQNMGACLRSADGAGVHAVVVPRDKSSPVTATARRAASGAVESVPFFQVKNLARALEMLKESGIWLVGAADDADKDIYHADLTGPIALILGAEGSGLRRLTREACDFLVRLPMYGSVASLNVAVATGICLYEALRQRMASRQS